MAQKSKTALVNAFLELIEEEEYDKITVTSLVEKCGISRQTFYYHFDDIDKMLEWAFQTETDKICKMQAEGFWIDSANHYTDFLSNYDLLLRKATKSHKFIFVYNLLFNSFYAYVENYYNHKKNRRIRENDKQFVFSCLASAFCGLVVQEIQKEQSDYNSLLKDIAYGFNLLPKQ